MEKDTIIKLHKHFEEYAYEQDGIAYWLARELQELLEYTQWRNFLNVIEKAKIACENSGNAVADHFADVSKMVKIGLSAERIVLLTSAKRYKCLKTIKIMNHYFHKLLAGKLIYSASVLIRL